VNVGFLLNDLHLSGGVSTVVEHARRLTDRHGWRVALVLVREPDVPDWQYRKLSGLPVLTLEQAGTELFDVVVATWWETTSSLFALDAHRYAYFVQSLEERFYLPSQHADRLGAAVTHDLPVTYITEARWIAQALEEGRRGVRCFYVRNGVDKDLFAPLEEIEVRLAGPLRILVEGRADVWFKGVGEALSAVGKMREARHVTLVAPDRSGIAEDGADRVVGPLSHEEMAELYSETDVVLKLSRVEGMFGPPLEGFHRGATCVVTPVTGHEEYVVHGWNGLVADWDDPRGTGRLLDLLARDRRLLHYLRTNALETARAWPSPEQSSDFMAGALLATRRLPPPDPAAGAERLLGDVRAAIEAYRVQLQERQELDYAADAIGRARMHPLVRAVRRARQHRFGRIVLWPFMPLLRWMRRRMLP
jgi:glycosyltransferase involved in cell wall biosynthesis